jgi:hypothetical protein
VQLIDDHSGNAPEARTVVKNPIGSECIPDDHSGNAPEARTVVKNPIGSECIPADS